jgi:hypothetical protein
MKTISIDGQVVDVTLEEERTVGDAVRGLETWLLGSGLAVNSIEVDGQVVVAAELEGVFERGLDDVRTLALTTTSDAALSVAAIAKTIAMLERAAGGSDTERAAVIAEWRDGPAASFIAERERSIAADVDAAIATGAFGDASKYLTALNNERLRELKSPVAVFLENENAVKDLVTRLADYALDVETGHDKHATETVNLFAKLTLKLIRLLPLLRACGVDFDALSIVDTADAKREDAQGFFMALNRSLGAFLEAYAARDCVQTGDLAEYEIAPRLRALYVAVRAQAEKSATVGGAR